MEADFELLLVNLIKPYLQWITISGIDNNCHDISILSSIIIVELKQYKTVSGCMVILDRMKLLFWIDTASDKIMQSNLDGSQSMAIFNQKSHSCLSNSY